MSEHFAGLDVSVATTAICVVDVAGEVAFRGEVVTDPEAIAAALAPYAASLKRVGHEAGALSPWLHPQLKGLGLPVVCLETRQVRAALAAQRNKTDAADALGLAHIVRTGWYRAAHVKTDGAYRLRLLLSQRRNLKRDARHLHEAPAQAVLGDDAHHQGVELEVLAPHRRARRQHAVHQLGAQRIVRAGLAHRPLEAPAGDAAEPDPEGLQRASAWTSRTASATRRSRDVAAYFGLTGRRWQSGTSIDIKGRVSKAGDGDVRGALYEAAGVMLTRFKGATALKTWGLKLAKAKGMKKAIVAVARKLAVLLHAMWRTGTDYADAPEGRGAARKLQKLGLACA